MPRGRPFVKGQPSANPRGRPKSDFTLAALAKQRTHKALAVLDEVMNDTDHPARVTAAKEMLDRGWGKSPLVLAGQGGVGPAEIAITWEESQGEKKQ